jgi:hypothetical protein
MPKPERRMGTREMVSGRMVLVGYSYPRWLLVCLTVSRQTKSARLERDLQVARPCCSGPRPELRSPVSARSHAPARLSRVNWWHCP